LDFDYINNVSREQISYLDNLSSDVQESIDTINQVKRGLTDNIFNGDVQIKSGSYGLTLKSAPKVHISFFNKTFFFPITSYVYLMYLAAYICHLITPLVAEEDQLKVKFTENDDHYNLDQIRFSHHSIDT
jgi:hypothetical protein